MIRQLSWLLAGVAVLAYFPSAGTAQDQAAEALGRFQKGWKPQQGYMRPLDDAGWKARMTAFRQLVRLGKRATPTLTKALAKGDADTRIFAAQALAFLADPASKPRADAALKDSVPAVRMYAIDVLSMFGKLQKTKQYQDILDKDSNGDVKSHMRFALARDDEPQPAAIQQALKDYELAKMNSAKRGSAAPDFTLKDPLGKAHTLSRFRDKKAVVLVFVYGDT